MLFVDKKPENDLGWGKFGFGKAPVGRGQRESKVQHPEGADLRCGRWSSGLVKSVKGLAKVLAAFQLTGC